ncbi:hypothetical protein L479_01127 [Exiguobacterium sp. S17]|nr:hypothetical protein L479_01127 [Exiguobacterium sp. S17]
MVHTWNERAHTALKGKTGTLLIWSFACSILLEIGLMVDTTYYGLAIESVALTVLSLGGILFYIAIYPVIVGYNWLILDTVRGKPVQLRDAFAPFRHRYGKHLLATLLVVLFQVLWTLLLVVPGIVKYFSYAFTYFILRDEPDLSSTEAITKSRDLMRGQKWDAFKLILPFIPMYLVGWIFTYGSIWSFSAHGFFLSRRHSSARSSSVDSRSCMKTHVGRMTSNGTGRREAHRVRCDMLTRDTIFLKERECI